MNPEFDPFDPVFLDDPYPTMRELREHDPVAWFAPFEAWILTRHEDVTAALRHPRFSAHKGHWTVIQRLEQTFDRYPLAGQIVKRSLPNLDAPDHTRLRSLVSRAFTPRVVERLLPSIEEITCGLLDTAAERGEMDLIRDFAYPLPVLVICDLLGLPAVDRSLLRGWSGDLRVLFDPTPPPEQMERAEKSAAELRDYLRGAFEERRRRPQDDLLSGLVAAEQAGDRMSGEELFAMVGLLLIAGHETTAGLIGNAVWALLGNPGEHRALRDGTCSRKIAVEEFLRFDTPVQLIARVALEDCEFAGRELRRGNALALMLGGANRDPAVFPDPDRLDLSRQPNPHVSLGNGAHFCLGAALARSEASVAIGALVDRFPGFHTATQKPERRSTLALRGLAALPLTLS